MSSNQVRKVFQIGIRPYFELYLVLMRGVYEIIRSNLREYREIYFKPIPTNKKTTARVV